MDLCRRCQNCSVREEGNCYGFSKYQRTDKCFLVFARSRRKHVNNLPGNYRIENGYKVYDYVPEYKGGYHG